MDDGAPMAPVAAVLAADVDCGVAGRWSGLGIRAAPVSGWAGVVAGSGWQLAAGGPPGPSAAGGAASALGGTPFIDAQAFTSVPSTGTCASDSGATSRCAGPGAPGPVRRIVAITAAAPWRWSAAGRGAS